MLLLATLLFIATTGSQNIANASPAMQSRPQVKSVSVGSSVDFVCSVVDQSEEKVRWWFDNHRRQISSNADILSDNKHKYSIWQPRGTDGVWVLRISNVTAMDAGHYRCDITNSDVALSSLLQVNDDVQLRVPTDIPRANFTGCCVDVGVPEHCLPICSPATFNLMAFDMERCRDYMPQLLHCGSDGSNHIPCCRRRYIPTHCLDICLGKLPRRIHEGHIICVRKTVDILACFEEGKVLLPGPPQSLLVRTMLHPGEPASIYLKWHTPAKNSDSVIGYYVFYKKYGSADFRSSSLVLNEFHQIDDLDPGIYDVYVVTVNTHGSSLPSYIVLVRIPYSDTSTASSTRTFPDPGYMLECCRRYKVSTNCLTLLCSDRGPMRTQDPEKQLRCLPEFNKVLPCFAAERNHTECCVRREVLPVCVPLCSGTPGNGMLQLLSCIPHEIDIMSCVREGYDIIPGPPLDLRLGRVTSTTASVQWDPPIDKQTPVKEFLVQYKEETADAYTRLFTTDTVVTLTDLAPSTVYVVKVSSLGHNGSSVPTPSIIFLTYSPSGGVLLSSMTTRLPSTTPRPHNVASCCQNSGVEDHCLLLCNYDADFRSFSPELISVCSRKLHAILECAVDGRNHTRCCQRRGVREPCTKFCEFTRDDVDKIRGADMCLFEMPKLTLCMKEGVALLPGPPRQLTVVNTTLNTISLMWLTPGQIPQGIVGYVVEYSKSNTQSPLIPLKTSAPHLILQNLDPDTEYVIRVSAYNQHGESLPSERLTHRTLPPPRAEKKFNFTAPINIEACCREKNVLPACMPACNNSAHVTYDQCHMELPKLAGCSADGRDHSECCKRREVPIDCHAFCRGQLPDLGILGYICMESLPQILSCFKEGLSVLPSPPLNFLLVSRGSRWLQFSWTRPDKNSDNVEYLFIYQETQDSNVANVKRIDGITTTQFKLERLMPFHQYAVTVTSVNRYGNSVPSTQIMAWTLQETPLKLSISQVPPGYIREHSNSVTLTCRVDDYPPLFSIHWLRNGVVRNSSRYTLQGVQRSDTGRYTCVTRNSDGKMYSLDHYIKIQFLPKVVTNRTRITRSPGQALLTCAFCGYPEHISWSRDGQNMSELDGWHDRRVITRVIDEKAGIVESRLTIMLVTESDFGTYLCRGENDLGGSDAVLVLRDETEEQILPFRPTTTYSSLAECCEARGVSVNCQVACSFDIDLGVLVSALNNPVVCVPDLPAIILCGADGKDHSHCCRNNSVPEECLAVCAGNVDALTNAHIPCIAHIATISNCMEEGTKNLPSSPRNVRALLSHGYITVNWDAPAVNGDKVTFYDVNYRRADIESALQVKVRSHLREVNLTRIHSHTQYYINVTSGNHHGNSAPSDTLVIKTLELMPSAPRNMTGHVLDDTSIRLSWDKPNKNPGAVLGYLITYAALGSHARNTVNVSDVLTYKLDGLTPLTTYEIHVQAQSSHFISPSSEVITVTTNDVDGYFARHFGGTTKVGLGIGLTFAVMVMVIVVGLALFCHMRQRTRSDYQFEDSVAFENPTYASASSPRISSFLNGTASTPGSSTELVAGSGMKETDSGNSDQGYATLSTMTDPTRHDKTLAHQHTDNNSDM